MENFVNCIPRGKENRIKRKDLQEKCNLKEKEFIETLKSARCENIIFVDSTTGELWRPTDKQEIIDFINKELNKMNDIKSKLEIAYRELTK